MLLQNYHFTSRHYMSHSDCLSLIYLHLFDIALHHVFLCEGHIGIGETMPNDGNEIMKEANDGQD